jgi:DNA mismatch repair protein MutS
VARLAGLPRSVIARSRQIMTQLEGGAHGLGGLALGNSPQLSPLAGAPPSPVVTRLAAVDVDRMTPLEALQLLAELKQLA